MIGTLDAAISMLGGSYASPRLDIVVVSADGTLSSVDPVEDFVPPPPKINEGGDSIEYCLYQKF